jgi:lipoprotein-anchoring transpeptidase ErfK/SrfK
MIRSSLHQRPSRHPFRITPFAVALCAALLAATPGILFAREMRPPSSLEQEEESGQSKEAEPSAMQTEAQRPTVHIEVNIPATEFTLYEDGAPLFVRPVAIGQGIYPTPEQESHIKKIEWNPWWYPPPDAPWAKDEKPTPPGPGNPLGLVKMPLSEAILFHGTNKERSVGRPASHGCMRMLNADATEIAWYLQSHFSSKNDPALRELYKKHSKTTYVVMLDEPVPVRLVYKPVIAREGKLIFYPDYYKKLANAKKKEEAILAVLAANNWSEDKLDRSKVNDLAKHWPPRGTEVPIESLEKSAPPPEIPAKPEKEKPARKFEQRSKYR